MIYKALAFDFGASSGRSIIGAYDGEVITLTETHRFENIPITLDDTLVWDMDALMAEVKTGLKKSYETSDFESIGIDTWGVDFGLIGYDGNLLENPVHYRDARTDNMMEEAFKTISKELLYEKTGIQLMQFNTLFQLIYLKKYKPELLERTDKILFMPDLFAYLLTDKMKTEYTIASTSQMLDPFKQDWDYNLLEQFDLPRSILCPISQPPDVCGELSCKICQELNVKKTVVVSVASHDTASAIVAVPADSADSECDFIYISCGTWSLFGTESNMPIVNKQSALANLTNEGGLGGKITFLKNIMGLWLIQEAKRQCLCEGNDLSFSELETEALASQPFMCFIDPDASEFLKPGDIFTKIKLFCKNTNQYVPQTLGEIMRCIYESLAMKYKYTLLEIENITGKIYSKIYIVGGGTQSKLLCQMTANCCNLLVSAGPKEATALGNIVAQFMAIDVIKDIGEARTIIRKSLNPEIYNPQQCAEWDIAYENFKKLFSV